MATLLVLSASPRLVVAQAPDTRVAIAFRDGYVRSEPGIALYYQVHGSGADTAVVIHGGPGFGMGYLVPDLLPLAVGRTLIFYDQRTGGRSTTVADTTRNNSVTAVADLEAVRKHFRLSRLNLIGHSWGSLLAGFYAAQYPDRVGRLVLIASSPPSRAVRDSLPRVEVRVDSLHAAWRKAHYERWTKVPTDTVKNCWDYWAINIRLYYASPDLARAQWGDVCNMLQPNLLTTHRGHPHTSLSARGFDLRPQLTNVAAPALVMHGERDIVHPLSARAWAAALPNSRLVLIPGAGHFPHVDAPDSFFTTVDAFLSEGVAPRQASAYERLYREISTRSNALAAAITAADWRRVAGMYDDRAFIFAPGAPPVAGRGSIESFWRAAYGKGLRTVHHLTIEVEREGSTAIEAGKYVVRGERDQLLDVGKYLIVWRRSPGGWLVAKDVYNSTAEQRSPLERPDYLGEPYGSWKQAP